MDVSVPDGLVWESFAGSVELFPACKKGDELRLGDTAAESFQDSLSRLSNVSSVLRGASHSRTLS
jgi:hypothetical protein